MFPALAVVVAASMAPGVVAATQVAQDPLQARVAVFLDCQTFCDFNFIRREITFVDWVRDRADADVHLLMTSQSTGSGGERYTLNFIGQRRFAGTSDSLKLSTSSTDVEDEIRAAQVRTLKLGLVRFAATTAVAPQLSVAYAAPTDSSAAASQSKDPWNYWVFNTRLNGSISGERRNRSRSIQGNASANRVTERLKIQLSVYGRRSHDEFDIDDTTTFINTSRSYDSNGLIALSLGNHWSAGLRASTSTSTFQNLDLEVQAGPALEFSIFPYALSERKAISLRYAVEVQYDNYEQETIFDRLTETHPTHSLEIGASMNQPWGSAWASAGASQYLHDLAKHSLYLYSGFNIRIVRGLEFNVYSSIERIKDQIFLAKTGATPEEVVAQRRQLGTDYSFDLNFGIGYRFGSKFNNVVNPRF